MHGHVWRPHPVVNDSLSVVPLLEEVTSILLMTWMNLWKVDHLLGELSLSETLVHKEIVFLMHGTVASLASSLENLETSSESGGVVGIPGDLGWPVRVTVMHTNGVDLLFITLDTMWSTDIISEQPSFRSSMTSEKWIGGNSLDDRSLQCAGSFFYFIQRRFHLFLYFSLTNEIIIMHEI